MNKILREEMEYLITCDDKAITPDVKDDVEMTLDYIDELENKIDKAIEYCEEIVQQNIDITDTDYDLGQDSVARDLLNILEGKDE